MSQDSTGPGSDPRWHTPRREGLRLPRRRFLQAAALAPLAGAAIASPARARSSAVSPASVDVSAASPELAAFMLAFFETKTSRDVDATMAFFSRDLVTYIDAVLGWDLAGYGAVRDIFTQYMPNWPDGSRSYPTRIVGDMAGGAFIAFTDTPELFGGELRILAALDFEDGKIVRWIDHWDGRDWPNGFGLAKAPLADYRVASLPASASLAMTGAAERLFSAFTSGAIGDDDDLFSNDVLFEDMALRSQLIGRIATHAYLNRALPGLPFGTGAAIRHVVGSDAGGAIEWTAASSAPVQTGLTGIVLDGDGAIVRLTTVYDGALYDSARIGAMSAAVLNI